MIYNPLKDVPLNNDRIYVRGITLDGCEVYMPVKATKNSEIIQKKIELQHYLDNQYTPTVKLPPGGGTPRAA